MLKYGKRGIKMKEIKIKVIGFSLNKTLRSEQCVADLFFLDNFSGHWITYIPVNTVWTKIMLKQETQDTLSIKYCPDNIKTKELESKIHYIFSLNDDYASFVKKFENDDYLMKVYEVSKGIRIMKDINKEYRIIESLLTQNTSVRMIKVMQRNLFVNYGTPIEIGNETIFTYPDLKKISNDEEESIREKIRCGYRARYIKNIAKSILSGELDTNKIESLDTQEARKYLMGFKGIGPKIVDLILMYGFSKKDVFPTDIWARKTISKIYFNGKDPTPKELTNFVEDYFGEYASLINLMIFYFERKDKNKFFNTLIWR
jgi:N-glycosylase/DNA lyase